MEHLYEIVLEEPRRPGVDWLTVYRQQSGLRSLDAHSMEE